MGIAIVAGIVLFAILLWGTMARARMARLQSRAEELWDEITAHLERRWDLVSQLIAAARVHAPDRTALFSRIEAELGQARAAESLPEHAATEQGLKDALFHLFALTLEDDALRETDSLSKVQNALEEAEDAIQKSRRRYNDIVYDLNFSVTTFPRNLIAHLFGFRLCDYYALPGEETDYATLGQRR